VSDTNLRTAAWYGDRPLNLSFPNDWRVTTLRPDTPAPLSDAAIVEALERPIGQHTIRELARGKSRPIVIVDDLTRPTPAGRVLPFVLRQLEDAGISSNAVTIMMATGAHGPASRDAIEKKVGPQAARLCRLLAHDHTQNLVKVGRTSHGTPVLVNREVRDSDFLVGIGGIYPQHSAGFGGGSKLALGVLGTRSISALHYRHPSMHGSYEIENDFRGDVDEIARLIGLETTISLQLDCNRAPVRLVSGDHTRYYRDEVSFAKKAYRAPPPGAADVVISNAYPIDVSLTFMRSKGIIPLLYTGSGASRIMISACPEGVGHHALFPFMNLPRFARQRHLARVALNTPGVLPRKIMGRVARRISPQRGREDGSGAGVERRNPIWLYPPGREAGSLPAEIPGMNAIFSWGEALEKVVEEQGRHSKLDVIVYPCAPLHVIDAPAAMGARVSGEVAALE
jgi:nickel-dependent lactate racemase